MFLTTRVATQANQLVGDGYELLIDAVDGSVIARFFDGRFLSSQPCYSELELLLFKEPTIVFEAA